MTIFSGIKPSGRPHVGNFLGAIQSHIASQNLEGEKLFFIADYHALTSLRDPQKMRDYSLGIAMDYLALGLDPSKASIFIQSHVPYHTELAWILSCVCNPGLLDRAHAWKDAQEKGQRELNIGLYTYPVLMAADILLYQATQVPVGKDQKQHVEIARDLAQKFNQNFGEVFTLPEPQIIEEIASIKGTDGQKMSKSYNNTISIFEDAKVIEKQVMSLQTQSLPLEAPMPIEDDLILELMAFFATEEEVLSMKASYQAGSYGYGRAKKALYSAIMDFFAEAREKRAELEKNPATVADILEQGRSVAMNKAQKTMTSVYEKTGLHPRF